ncbi:hypothetical protein [Neorhizobium galegae]|uniref:hypothetical protein n=1 Tax=Neorhizobium galegae TaxID=399 RepID=UPI000621BBC2|nr:hypothetical protein [Neorhizobium galegae]CDZ47725.1 Hypothetical protein NGAL_HAMBI2427_23090 [Neorhizobium galegae bv. orientalis]
MKVAGHVLAYNVDRFLPHVVENCGRFVDKIFIVLPERPWAYLPGSRATRTNPTTREKVDEAIAAARAKGVSCETEVICSDFETEEGTRNDCLDRATREGYDWLVIQDADEFYLDSGWETLLEFMAADRRHDRILTPWHNFWKTPELVLTSGDGSIRDVNAGFAIRCKSGVRFDTARKTTPAATILIDAPCYHYGYVMSDAEMWEKITSWGHAHQVNAQKWFRLKWLGWTPAHSYLHPVTPLFWPKAIRFPGRQPAFASSFMSPSQETAPLGFVDFLENMLADRATDVRIVARKLLRRSTV